MTHTIGTRVTGRDVTIGNDVTGRVTAILYAHGLGAYLKTPPTPRPGRVSVFGANRYEIAGDDGRAHIIESAEAIAPAPEALAAERYGSHLPYNPNTDRYETGGDEIEFADESEDDDCEGHPAGEFDPMGETVYCDGSCRRRRRR